MFYGTQSCRCFPKPQWLYWYQECHIIQIDRIWYSMSLIKLYMYVLFGNIRCHNADQSKSTSVRGQKLTESGEKFSDSCRRAVQMVTLLNGNICCVTRVTGPSWGESTSDQWIPLTKASDAELWCFLWCAPEQTAEQTVQMSVIWDTIALIMMSL